MRSPTKVSGAEKASPEDGRVPVSDLLRDTLAPPESAQLPAAYITIIVQYSDRATRS